MVPTLTSSMTEPPMTSNPFRPLALARALALTCMTMTMTMTDNAQTQPPAVSASEGTLRSVSAQTESSRLPAVASLYTGVLTQSPEAHARLATNANKMNKDMDADKTAGIAANKIRTSP